MSPSRTAKSVPAGGGAVMANLPQGVMAPAPEPTGTPWDAARQLEPDAAADGGHRPAQTTRTVPIRTARSGGERDGARGRSPPGRRRAGCAREEAPGPLAVRILPDEDRV